MQECRQCQIGFIGSHGYCDTCGFNELRFVEEYELYLDATTDKGAQQDYEQWDEYLAA